MPFNITAVSICDAALKRVNSNVGLNSFIDETDEATAANAIYYTTKRSLISSNDWHFSMRQEQLTQETAEPQFGFKYKYVLPSDYLKLVNVHNDIGTSHQVYQNRLYIDQDVPLYVTIQYDVDEQYFPPSFKELLEFKLAAQFAIMLPRDQNLANMWISLYETSKPIAIRIDKSSNTYKSIPNRAFNITTVRY